MTTIYSVMKLTVLRIAQKIKILFTLSYVSFEVSLYSFILVSTPSVSRSDKGVLGYICENDSNVTSKYRVLI